MSNEEEFKVEKKEEVPNAANDEHKIIDESNYNVHRECKSGQPYAVGQGGDPFFRRIRASKEELMELLKETTTVQDWLQREVSNKVALTCLDNENLKEVYYEIKNGFGDYGPILLMGFKTPMGVEIPRLKIFDSDGEIIEVLTGPAAIDELNKRALAYKESKLNNYEVLPDEFACDQGEIADYKGMIDDYSNTV